MTAPAMSSHLAVIEHAVLTLAKRCDGALEQDGQGFNKWDSDWGHATADEISRGGHVDPVRALKVVSKYRKQLGGAGIALPDLTAVIAEVDANRPALVAQSIVDPRTGLHVTLTDAKELAIHGSYPDHVDVVRSLPKRRWAPELEGKPWIVPASFIAQVVTALPGAHLGPEVREMVAAKTIELESAAHYERETAARRAVAIDSDTARYESILPTLERTPFAHQDSGIRWLIETRFAILADDMGLGKTFQALLAAKAIGHRIIVVAPAGLRLNWIREAAAVQARIEIYSWAKVPEAIRGDYTLIADEAHYAQNMKAQRTKRFLDLAKLAKAVFALTGTPIKNGRPTNLFPLLVATQHPLGKDRRKFERRYCNAGPTRWTKWDVTGAAHLEELHELIADGLLRRMKDECLDLPGKLRVIRDLRDDLSSEALARFQRAFDDMQADYERRKALGEIDEADALVMLNHLRHASSLCKVEAAIEMAEEVIEQGGQVVLFTAFLDSANEIVRALNAGRITGEDDTDSRQATIDRFQAGFVKSIVCTLGAGNVGITLTAAQTVILVDRPWTPGDALQAEDRLYRIGQKSSVLAVWLEATESDVGMDALLENKHTKSEVIMTGSAPVIGLLSPDGVLTGDHAKYDKIVSAQALAKRLLGRDG